MTRASCVCASVAILVGLLFELSCTETSCEDTLTCSCTTPPSGDQAVAGECTTIEIADCTYAACVRGVCMAKPVDAGTPCASGICNAEGTCETGTGGGLGLGEPCTSSDVCASNFCADQVCCETACDGVCESCNLAGSEGTCAADAEASDPADDCAGEAACDGSGACLYGKHLWSKKFATATVGDMAVDAAGNIIVVGYFSGTVSFGGASLTSSGGDVFVAKFDANGDHLWSNRFGDPDGQEAFAVAVDGSGNIFVGGRFNGSMNFGGANLSNADNAEDIFLAKLSASGAHAWSKSYAVTGFSSDSGELFDIAVDSSDNVIFTGWIDTSVNFGGGVLSGSAGGDPYLVKLGTSGAPHLEQGIHRTERTRSYDDWPRRRLGRHI